MSSKRNCYEILGVERGASVETVRRAYRRLSTLFEPGNPTLHGLYDAADAGALLAEVRHAYRVLTDPSARQEHDAFLFPDQMRVYTSVELEVADNPDDQVPLDAPPVDLVQPDSIEPTELVPVKEEESGSPGRRLKVIRQRLGMSLEDIADRTKIATFTLKCIEDESFRDLPAPIYVRGFLKQVGQILRVESDPLIDEYLAQYDVWRKAREPASPFS